MSNESINESWERQPGESSKAFKAFELYLRMGYKRSLKKVALQLDLKTARYLYHWKSQYRWNERIFAYENEQQKLQNAADLELYKNISEKQLSLATNLRQLLGIPLKIITDRLKPDKTTGKVRAFEDFDNLGTVELFKLMVDASKFVDVVIKTERLAIGQPTEIKREENNNHLDNYGNIIAGDENATQKLFELIDFVTIPKNSQSNNNGEFSHTGSISDGKAS